MKKYSKNIKLYTIATVAYFIFMLSVILIFNPDFTRIENNLLFVPMAYFAAKTLSLMHEDDGKYAWILKIVFILIGAIVVLFVRLANNF